MKLRSRVISKSGSCVSTDEKYNSVGQEELDRKHPLLNDVVLTTLFKFMSKMDLKKCRLVCQKWCVLSLPSTRSKFNIRLKGNGVAEESTRTRSVTDFVEVFKHNKLGIPFANYTLVPFCTTEGPGHEFLQICGSTAKTVSLIQNQPGEPYVLTVQVEDVAELLKAMPNLEYFYISHRIHSQSGNIVKLFPGESSSKLSKPRLPLLKKFEVSDKSAVETKDYCPTFIEEVLSIAPNVSAFRAQDSNHDLEKSRIGEVLNAIGKLKRESVIKNLFIVGGRTEHFESLQKLAKNGLKLKSLDFLIAYGEKNEKSYKFLPSLATLFKNSVEHLCVEEDCTSFIQLPFMPKLQKFDLHITKDFDSKCVNLKKLFPALKVLELQFYCGWNASDESEWEEFLPNSEPCPNVKYFSLDRPMKIQVFDHILNIFPKLTKLELDVGKDGGQIIRKIMTQMTQLEKLSLNGTVEGIESIDALLTGIPDRRIRELANVAAELKEMTVQLRADTIRHYRSRHCQFSSLANLTYLKHLYLNTSGRSEAREDEPMRETRLTDVFLYFCLSSMKHLNKFTTENCRFSKTGTEIVTTEMGLKKWELIHSIINEVE